MWWFSLTKLKRYMEVMLSETGAFITTKYEDVEKLERSYQSHTKKWKNL